MDIPNNKKSEMIQILISQDNVEAFKDGGKPEPNWIKADEARTEGDTIYYTDDESKDHEYYGHYAPDQEALERLRPFYENLNDDKLKNEFGTDLDFVKRLDGDPGYFFSPEEVLARVSAASRFLSKNGITEITPEFLKKARQNENAYGYNFRDLLHMFNDDNLMKIGIMSYKKGGKTEPAYKRFLKTLPENQRRSADEYRMERFWELNGKPKDFEEAVSKGMFNMNDDGFWHANSVAYNSERDVYEFMKSKDHEAVGKELEFYYNNPDFSKEWEVTDDPENPGFYMYKRKQQDMTLDDILKLNISDSAKEEITKAFAVGGEIKKEKKLNPSASVKVGDKEFEVEVADTDDKRKDGLSRVKDLDEDEGMLFVFEEETEVPFTMADTSIDLDIVFIDDSGEVITVKSVKAFDETPVRCGGPFSFVLEVNYNSGIEEGDMVKFDDALSEEDMEKLKHSKMLVLNSEGDVQMRLEGGERIVSMIKTRQLIKAVLKAYKIDTDQYYKKVGRLIINEFDAQDNRDPQYVEKPDNKK